MTSFLKISGFVTLGVESEKPHVGYFHYSHCKYVFGEVII